MRLLLDTHAFVWTMGLADKLPSRVVDAVGDPDNDVWVSAVAIYELEYKRGQDRALNDLPDDLVSEAMAVGFRWLDVSPSHARVAARLDRSHRDPWDRMIVGQAIVENLRVVTRDPALARLGGATYW